MELAWKRLKGKFSEERDKSGRKQRQPIPKEVVGGMDSSQHTSSCFRPVSHPPHGANRTETEKEEPRHAK